MDKDLIRLGEGLDQDNLAQNVMREGEPMNEREQDLNAGNVAMGRGGVQAPAGFQAPPLVAGNGFAQAPMPGNLSEEEVLEVRERLNGREEGAALTTEQIKKGRNGAPVTAHVNRTGHSMAADPEFEQRAMAWEMRFGGVVNEEPRTRKMADKIADFVSKYMYARIDSTERALSKSMPKLGYGENTFSGAVGKEWKTVYDVLWKGSVSSRMLVFQAFAEKFFKGDVEKLGALGATRNINKVTGADPNPQLNAAMGRVINGGRMQSPDGIPGEQWHTRAERNPPRNVDGLEGQEKEAAEEYNKTKDQSKRTYGQFKGETGTDYSQAEKEFMGLDGENKDGETLPINEGGEKWIINETDKWVKFMRDLSLPLLAGPSGTTARLFQAFQQFGLNDQPAHSRLATIAYILPNRHHSLVEIMTGAAQNGGPAFTPHQRFYREIEPFGENELRGKMGMPFPDETAAV